MSRHTESRPDRPERHATANTGPYLGGCFLCHKESDCVVLREGEMGGRRCSCGLVYAYPLAEAGIKSPLADHHNDAFYAAPSQIKVDWLAKHISHGRLLEVGCGMGHFLAEARGRGFEVAGMEPNPMRAVHVREKLKIDVDQSFLHRHRIPDGSFDIVYHCDMLSHFTDPPAALAAMAKPLRADGVLFVEVGTLGGVDPRWYPWVGGIGLKHHIWLYSKRSLDLLFAKAGLEIVAERRFGLAPQIVVPKLLEMSYAMLKRLAGAAQIGPEKSRVRVNSISSTRTPQSTSFRQGYLEKLKYFLRYHVGRIAPRIGPQTYFFLLKPGSTRSPG